MLTTVLYQLPFGRGATFLSSSGRLMDAAVGGWQLGGVLVFQSGAFMTIGQSSVDSANTGILNTLGVARADVVPGVGSRAVKGLTNSAGPVYINPNAFTLPPVNAGRFGTSSVGNVVGPGTDAVSLSLIKSIKITEQLQFQFGAQAANALNHRNYDVPNQYVDECRVWNDFRFADRGRRWSRNVEITGGLVFNLHGVQRRKGEAFGFSLCCFCTGGTRHLPIPIKVERNATTLPCHPDRAELCCLQTAKQVCFRIRRPLARKSGLGREAH